MRRERPSRPTLFEFFLNNRLYKRLAGPAWIPKPDAVQLNRMLIAAFSKAGYDYATVRGCPFAFDTGPHDRDKSISLNQNPLVTDRKSFDAYKWHDPDGYNYSALGEAAADLPRDMRLIVCGPGGVLENAVSIAGYDNLCLMFYDDPQLAGDLFENIGERLVRYYRKSAAFDTVGALISNDDWGFKTQTMISLEQLRKYVFPWHKRIVETIHAAGKPAILHSCGKADDIMDDIIDLMGYDGKHSYEDAIMPVEEAYRRWHRRIAILGGIDVDFICRAPAEAIERRARAMLDLSASHGSYALGTGNSVPDFVPDDKYFALIGVITGKIPGME